jgi:hypothetical protein
MLKVIEGIMKLVTSFATNCWWPIWSNFRWRNAIRNNIGVNEGDKVSTYKELQTVAARLYKKFKYERDSITELWDSITPPPQNYQHYRDGKLSDDCDGFASLMYHVLYNCGLKCYFMTVNTLGGSHCVILLNLNSKWHVCDYYTIYKGYETWQEAVQAYNEIFPSKYNIGHRVYFNGFIVYNYENGKFNHVNKKDIGKV